ncbi:patatin-like phospholipase family protein [Kribbella sp. CA-293567]|uniref:patatin-like phospholipase family protein n=1 Tax=Kribbella sp. CA-293567 TaxID=3002436 RepID=UPI0022DD8F08|nr:patatin-like phospholipase family protein [Kribbella sp. CA-293567]WBQ08404.1 patatin-like phospholipase family protein [Kribbella sp. CA-293567]
MSRALVLGGGGPLGIAWQAGLLGRLQHLGITFADADLILGTSAGSVVGAALATDGDLAALAQQVTGSLPTPAGTTADIPALQALTADAVATTATAEEAMARIGQYALAAATVDESGYVGSEVFASFAATAWPAAFRCTGIDAKTGRLRVWDAADGYDLPSALAASCAVPGLFPPITVGGARYLDGGMLSPLNVPLAAGYDEVVVVSCFALSLPAGIVDPGAQQRLAEIGELRRQGAKVTVIEPSQRFLDISGWGADVMDTSRAPAAYEAGVQQAEQVSERTVGDAGGRGDLIHRRTLDRETASWRRG